MSGGDVLVGSAPLGYVWSLGCTCTTLKNLPNLSLALPACHGRADCAGLRMDECIATQPVTLCGEITCGVASQLECILRRVDDAWVVANTASLVVLSVGLGALLVSLCMRIVQDPAAVKT